jgi:hypothetical protein
LISTESGLERHLQRVFEVGGSDARAFLRPTEGHWIQLDHPKTLPLDAVSRVGFERGKSAPRVPSGNK